MLRKATGWAVVILVVVWIIHDPTGSAASVRTWAGDVVGFAQSLTHR